MGVYQHHDAVSGTAKQAVADDYSRRLSTAMTHNLDDMVGKHLANETLRKLGIYGTEFKVCKTHNDSIADCPWALNDNKAGIIAVHNPSGRLFRGHIKVRSDYEFAGVKKLWNITDGKPYW